MTCCADSTVSGLKIRVTPMFKNKKKLPSKVKYQSTQFRTKLARARTYQRNSGGLSKYVRYFRSKQWSFRLWLFALAGLGLFIFLVYLVFYPNWLYIREVKIVGARTALEQELRGQVERYLDQRTFLVPHKNLLFLRSHDLQSYLLAVNPGVWRVDEIKKHWPHALTVQIVPRDPAFTVTTQEGTWLVSNDGLTLPSTTQQTNTLAISANGLKAPELGKVYLSGNLLATLTAVKKSFAALTGLPSPTQVVLKPVVLDARLSPTTNSMPVATGSVAPPPADLGMSTASDLMPEEVQVVVPASGLVSAFNVLLQTTSDFDEVFRQLQVLLSKQGSDRLQHLAYIDMRFAGKAFICLQNTPCARPEGVSAPQPPAVNPSAPKQ